MIEVPDLVHARYTRLKHFNIRAYQQGVWSLRLNWDIKAGPSIQKAMLVFQLVIILNIGEKGTYDRQAHAAIQSGPSIAVLGSYNAIAFDKLRS